MGRKSVLKFHNPDRESTAPASKTAWSLQLAIGLPSQTEEFRRVNVNFAFENVEDQDGVSSEESAFQREEIVLAKPFLVWHVTKTSH